MNKRILGIVFLFLFSALTPMVIGNNVKILDYNMQSTMCINSGIPPPEEWNKTFGGTKKDGGFDVSQTSDDGYIIAGVTSSFGYGNDDLWLVKTDSSGNEQWNKTYGGTRFEAARSILQTSEDCFTVLGITSSFGAGSFDMWLVKTDSSGNELWNNTFGGTNTDYGLSLCQTADGGYILIGYTNSYGAGKRDVWLVKTDGNGNEQWNKTYGRTELDDAWDGQITSDGGFIITGITGYTGEQKPFLIKIDSFGNEEWNKTYHETGFTSCAYSVWETVNGGYIICGAKGIFLESCGVFLLKTDEFGTEQWNKTLYGKNDDFGLAIQQVDDGGYIIAGEIKNERDYSEVLLLKTDEYGNEQWNKTFSKTLNNRGWSVKQTNEGGFIIIGETDFYGLELGNAWLIKIAKENHPPAKPSINGSSNGKPRIEYNYTSVSSDPDGDEISYYFYWGDGTNSGWTEFVPSGFSMSRLHSWQQYGTYIIKVKAKDVNYMESDWKTMIVIILKNKNIIINPLFLKLLEKVPILEKVR